MSADQPTRRTPTLRQEVPQLRRRYRVAQPLVAEREAVEANLWRRRQSTSSSREWMGARAVERPAVLEERAARAKA
jgi:hypothetical protein